MHSEPTTTAALDAYLDLAIGKAADAFWAALAATFPAITSGDMTPHDVDAFDTAATVAARAWVRANVEVQS